MRINGMGTNLVILMRADSIAHLFDYKLFQIIVHAIGQ